MAGFSRIFCLGEPGGFQGADGLGSIAGMILVGDGSRQWWEPRYLAGGLEGLGRVKVMVPAGPDSPDALLDACLLFFPAFFEKCSLLRSVEKELGATEQVDFDLKPEAVPKDWPALRREAQPLFAGLCIYVARLEPVSVGAPAGVKLH